MITDIGLNRWGTGAIVTYCRVGTGTAAATVNDQDLEVPLASTGTSPTTTSTGQPSAPYYVTCSKTFTFTQGAVVGNISEVGVGWAASGNTLWSRARIKNGAGADTTITVTAIEQLSVVYQLRLNIPSTDVVTTETINGVSTTVTVRAAVATNPSWTYQASPNYLNLAFLAGGYNGNSLFSGGIADITSYPSGSTGATTHTNETYVNDSLQIVRRLDCVITQGNFGGIGSIYWQLSPGYWQVGFVPPIAKDATQTFTCTCVFSWGRS